MSHKARPVPLEWPLGALSMPDRVRQIKCCIAVEAPRHTATTAQLCCLMPAMISPMPKHEASHSRTSRSSGASSRTSKRGAETAAAGIQFKRVRHYPSASVMSANH
jgi:hypothetical protein